MCQWYIPFGKIGYKQWAKHIQINSSKTHLCPVIVHTMDTRLFVRAVSSPLAVRYFPHITHALFARHPLCSASINDWRGVRSRCKYALCIVRFVTWSKEAKFVRHSHASRRSTFIQWHSSRSQFLPSLIGASCQVSYSASTQTHIVCLSIHRLA